MFRHIKYVLIAIVFAGSAVAHATDAKLEAAKDALWAAISEEDYAAVEAALANAQADYLKNSENRETIRALLGMFYANNPQLVQFTEGWLSAYPKSPFAHTAQAWLYHRVSWDIRGGGLARYIYPQARAEFRGLQIKAWEHAKEAYEADNALLPAADAVIRLAISNGQHRRGYKVLRQVMEKDPNMGTLRRGIGLTAPGWGPGGTWRKAENLCDHYGPMIEGHDTDPVTYCKIFALGTYHYDDETADWLRGMLMTGEYPDLEYLIMHWVTHSTATRAEAEFARAYLNREDVTDVKYAEEFDMNIALRYNFEFVGEAHMRRAQAEAREALRRDPYNPDLIKTLQRLVMRTTRSESSYRSTKVDGPTREERIEYARRMLIASPYKSTHWSDYGRELYPQSAENVLKDEPFKINAIVYSDHKPGQLLGYAFDKWRLLAALERLETETQSTAFQRLDENRKANVRREIQQWLAVRETMDLDEDLRCPMMRAYRLYEFICETSKDPECEPLAEQIEMLEIVRNNVNARRACVGVIASQPRDLFYSPIPVDLSAPEG